MCKIIFNNHKLETTRHLNKFPILSTLINLSTSSSNKFLFKFEFLVSNFFFRSNIPYFIKKSLCETNSLICNLFCFAISINSLKFT